MCAYGWLCGVCAGRIATSFRPFLNSFPCGTTFVRFFLRVVLRVYLCVRVSTLFHFYYFLPYTLYILLLPTVSVSHFEEALISAVTHTLLAFHGTVGHVANQYTDTQAVKYSLISLRLSVCVAVDVVVGGILVMLMWGRCVHAQKIFVFALLAKS